VRRIAAHNARKGRATQNGAGRQFDATFMASAPSLIGRASSDQLLLALLEAEERRCDKNDGSITLAGNRYWSPELIELAGEKVTVRCDLTTCTAKFMSIKTAPISAPCP
jgi:hypothetical protein